jgi:hypothetical protein
MHIKVISILLLSLLSVFFAKAQEDPKSSDMAFGQYLLLTGQYELAVLEFERLYFQKSEAAGLKNALVETHRLSGNYDRARKYAQGFSLQRDLSNLEAQHFKKEIILNSLLMKDFVWIPSVLAEIRITSDNDLEILKYVDNMSLGLSILNAKSKWETYHLHISGMEKHHDGLLAQALTDWQESPRKSPFVAGALSTFLPGAGKAYAGRWKDGLVSLLFVGANAYSSYRGFSNGGIRSPYGWLFGGLTAGFYLGGIYGSQKAARIYNHELEAKIKSDVYTRLLLFR